MGKEKKHNTRGGIGNNNGGGANNLMGLFDPPPTTRTRTRSQLQQQQQQQPSQMQIPPPPPPPASENDVLLPSFSDVTTTAANNNNSRINNNNNISNNKHNNNNNRDEENEESTNLTIKTRTTTTATNDEETVITPRCYGSNNNNINSNRNTNNRHIITSITTDEEEALLLSSSTSDDGDDDDDDRKGEKATTKTTTSTSTSTTSCITRTARYIRNLLQPYTLLSTWLGGIMFVLYHVVFCMANGGSIIRPSSSSSTSSSIIGDMARYTAVGIIGSCPLLIYRLQQVQQKQKGGVQVSSGSAMYPSTDLFLAPFLAEAAALIDKCITEDYHSGLLVIHNNNNNNDNNEYDNDDEISITRLWFGSFGVVISFGMMLSGLLLIVASKIKLANLGTFLPYGVLCGFFSAVGMLMWKLAITIDTPTISNSSDHTNHNDDWKIILIHHLPSLFIGVAMNRLGPKHSFFVSGLLLFTLLVFYGIIFLVPGITLQDAVQHGWFYSHNELQSSITSSSTLSSSSSILSISPTITAYLPPSPFGIWFAIWNNQYVYWKAVLVGVKEMIPLAILYLLRASIHATAMKKNTFNLVRRVPVQVPVVPTVTTGTTTSTTTTDTNATTIHTKEKGNDDTDTDTDLMVITRRPTLRRRPSTAFPQSTSSSSSPATYLKKLAYDGANQVAKVVRDEVQIINLSLADKQTSKGRKIHNSSPIGSKVNNNVGPARVVDACSPGSHHHHTRKDSTRSNITVCISNINNNRNHDNGDYRISSDASRASLTTSMSHCGGAGDLIPPVPSSKPLSSNNTTGEGHNYNHNYYDNRHHHDNREVSTLTHRTISLTSETECDCSGSGDNNNNKTTTSEDDDIIDYVEIRASPTDLTLEEIFVEYGYGFFVTALIGGFGCCPTIATSNTMYAVGAGGTAPQYLSIFLLLVVFYIWGFEIVRFIPKTAFSSLLVLSAADSIVTWFINPISKMDTLLEWSVVPIIVLCSLFTGMLNAIILGIGVSTFLFVAAFFRVGVVKYDASGLEIRSRIERSLVQSVWLDTHGDGVRVLILQNYLFFGNATSILRYISTMFEDVLLDEAIQLDFAIPPVPIVLVLDLSLITGMDTSSVDVFMDIWRLCKSNDCKLYVCGCSPRLRQTFARGGMKPDSKGPKKSRTFLYFSDFDHGLGRAEDILLLKMDNLASLFRLEKKTGSGFYAALQHIDHLHGIEMTKGLLGLESYTRIVTLREGQILFQKDGGIIREEDHGLFFIEEGMIRVEDDSSSRTNTRTGSSIHLSNSLLMESNANTLKGKHARLNAAARQAALAKSTRGTATSQSNNMRIATFGPGWVIGTHEFATGQHSLLKFKARTKIKMHHIPFKVLQQIEKENPIIILKLYKILTHVMARKEEDIVAHLSTLHGILSSTAVHSNTITRSSVANSAFSRR